VDGVVDCCFRFVLVGVVKMVETDGISVSLSPDDDSAPAVSVVKLLSGVVKVSSSDDESALEMTCFFFSTFGFVAGDSSDGTVGFTWTGVMVLVKAGCSVDRKDFIIPKSSASDSSLITGLMKEAFFFILVGAGDVSDGVSGTAVVVGEWMTS